MVEQQDDDARIATQRRHRGSEGWMWMIIGTIGPLLVLTLVLTLLFIWL